MAQNKYLSTKEGQKLDFPCKNVAVVAREMVQQLRTFVADVEDLGFDFQHPHGGS